MNKVDTATHGKFQIDCGVYRRPEQVIRERSIREKALLNAQKKRNGHVKIPLFL
jgi:hypothetical protein